MSDRGRGGRGRGGADRGSRGRGDRGGGSFRGGEDRGGRGGGDRGGSFRGGEDRGGRGGGDRGGSSRGGGDRGYRGGRGGEGRGRGGDQGDRGSSNQPSRGGGGGGRGGNTVVVFRDPNAPLTGLDSTVMNIENTYMQNTRGAGAMSNLSVTDQFPARPGYGTAGKKIAVYANYFKLQAEQGLHLTRYNVEVQPEVKGRKLSRVIQLLTQLPQFAGVASDYKSMILTRQTLAVQAGQVFDIQYLGDGEDTPLPNAITYKVRVVTPLSFGVADFVSYLSATTGGSTFPQRLEVIQALNVLLGSFPQADDGTTSIAGNRHFSLDQSPQNRGNIHDLRDGLESLRGYFQSVRPATGGILLNVNVTHGVFLQPRPLEFHFSQHRGNLLMMQKKLKLIRVQVIHIPPKKNKVNKDIPRIKTIFGLAHPQDGQKGDHPPRVRAFGAGPKDVMFWLSDAPPTASTAGTQPSKKGKKPAAPTSSTNNYISVFDYFQKKYPSIQIKDRVPVVNVGTRENPSYLPAEVCVVLPGQAIKRRLSPAQTAEMIKFACRRPHENGQSIVGAGKAVLGLNPGQNPILARFGIAVGTSLITVAARVLVPPTIKYRGSDSRETSVRPKDGSWNMTSVKFHIGSNLGPWTYAWFKSDRRTEDRFEAPDIRATVLEFKGFLANAGINSDGLIQSPSPPTIHLRDPPSIDLKERYEAENDTAIQNIFKNFSRTSGPNKPRFVLCILPYADTPIYNSIKKVADLEVGIHTVCVLGKKFMQERGQYQFFGNISLKFNLKARGINQIVDPPKLGIISEGKTMVVGLDVTHPSPGSKEGAPSVAAIVASVDKFLGQWPGTFSVQEGRKEMVSSLEALFLGRLRLWQKLNGQRFPDNIILYRDGVSEGQYQQLLDLELPLIRNACRQAYPASATKQGLPKISIIVCGKRHHTRFYPTSEETADIKSNCPPGTVVDRGVTQTRFWDFFLQPHTSLQGTARPGHYVVVLDEIFRGRNPKPPHQNAADALEELTYTMCHLFGRATKSVSLCPAAYYADLLCTRARCYLSDQFDPDNASTTASTTSGATSQTTFNLGVAPNIADSMWYI